MSRQLRAQRLAYTNVGCRCRFNGELAAGTIEAVEIGHGGWPIYVVKWDSSAPAWWSDRLSTSNPELLIGDAACAPTAVASSKPAVGAAKPLTPEQKDHPT